MKGRIDIARDVHAAILETLPSPAEVVISWANLQRRQSGPPRPPETNDTEGLQNPLNTLSVSRTPYWIPPLEPFSLLEAAQIRRKKPPFSTGFTNIDRLRTHPMSTGQVTASACATWSHSTRWPYGQLDTAKENRLVLARPLWYNTRATTQATTATSTRWSNTQTQLSITTFKKATTQIIAKPVHDNKRGKNNRKGYMNNKDKMGGNGMAGNDSSGYQPRLGVTKPGLLGVEVVDNNYYFLIRAHGAVRVGVG